MGGAKPKAPAKKRPKPKLVLSGSRADSGRGSQPRAPQPRPTTQRLSAGVPSLEAAPGQRAARRAGDRAARAAPEVALPAYPKLAHPSNRQRAAIVEGTTRALSRAGVSPEERAARGRAGTRRERTAINRAKGSQQTLQRGVDISVAMRALGANPKTTRPRHGHKNELAAMGREISRSHAITAHPSTPHKRVGIGPASVDVTALGRGLVAGAAEHVYSGHGGALREKGLVGNTLRDAGNFPIGAVKGIYELGRAGAGLARYLPRPVRPLVGAVPIVGVPISVAATASSKGGDSGPARRIADAQTRGPVGELVVHGDPKAALRSAKEHPLYAGLEVAGAYSVLGRTAGALARAGAGGRRLKASASTKRAPLQAYEGNQPVERSYSKNLFTEAIQKSHERGLRKKGIDPNVARDQPLREVLHTLSGATLRGGRKSELHQGVDEFSSQAEGVRRLGREELRKGLRIEAPTRGTGRRAAASRARGRPRTSVRGREVTAHPERNVVALLVEHPNLNALKDPAELHRYLVGEQSRLKGVYDAEKGRMSLAARRGNKAQRAHIQAVLDDPKALANAPEVVRAAKSYKRRAAPVRDTLVKQHALEAEQALAAEVRPAAVRAGAVHETTLPKDQRPSVARHDQAKGLERQFRAHVQTWEKAVGDAQTHLDKTVAKHSVQRASDRSKLERGQMDMRTYLRREAQRGRATKGPNGEPPDGMAGQALRRLNDAKKGLKKARKEHGGAKKLVRDTRPRESMLGMVGPNGQPISTKDITDWIHRTPGAERPGFVSHAPTSRGAQAHFVNWFDRRKTTGAHKRTGESTRVGGHGIDERTLHDSLIHSQGIADAVSSWDHFIGQMGHREAGKTFRGTTEEAQAIKDRIEEAGGPEMTLVDAVPKKLSPAARADVERAQGTQSQLDMGPIVDEQIARATELPVTEFRGGKPVKRTVTLIPTEQIQRFRDHQTLGTGPAGRAAQKITGIFRGTVLPFSTKWVFGNVVEAALRSALAGINPLRDQHIGKMLIRELEAQDAKAARAFKVRATGGLLFGETDRLNVFRDRSALRGTGAEPLGAAIGSVARLPVIRHLLAGLDGYQRAVFGLNKAAERWYQQGVIGKQARREIQELSGSWVKATRAQKDAVRDVARGLQGTPAQVRFAREVDKVLGKYTRFSPTMRRTTQIVAPFLPWYINSLRFVLHTLPVEHPFAASVIAKVEQSFQQDWDTQAKSLPPGDLKAAIALRDGGLLPLARYSPFGAFTNLPAGAVDPFLPQISTVVNILNGKNFTGKDLQVQHGMPTKSGAPGHDPTSGQKAGMALYAAFESVAAGFQLGRRLQEHGETSWDDSTFWAPKTKPDTSHGSSSFERVFNPLRPTYLSKNKPKGNAALLRKLTEAKSPARRVDPLAAAVRGAQPNIADDPEVAAAIRAAAGIR